MAMNHSKNRLGDKKVVKGMPFLSFDGNRSYVDAAIAAIDAGHLNVASTLLSKARRAIQQGTTVVHTTKNQGASAKAVAHPDRAKFLELDGYLRRALQSLSRSDAQGARTELDDAIRALGWT
jgi:hypothetical protein